MLRDNELRPSSADRPRRPTALVWPLTAIWGDMPGPVERFTIVGGGLVGTAVLIAWIAGLAVGAPAADAQAVQAIDVDETLVLLSGAGYMMQSFLSLHRMGRPFTATDGLPAPRQ